MSNTSHQIKGSAWNKARAKALANATHCAICGQPLDHTAPPRTRWSPTVDHIVPRSQGGSILDPKNLRPAHYGCNSRRKDGQPRRRKPTPTTSSTSRAW